MEVCDADSQLLCTFADQLTLLCAHSMGDFSGIHAVLHHQDLQFADIVDGELLETTGEHVACLSVGSVTDVWHQVLSLKTTSDTIVNTFRFTPVLLKCGILISFVPTVRQEARQLTFTLTYRSDWWRINFFVLFLRILGLNAGRTAMFG